jgi:Kef-type K+ transport system membrane component KefB
MAVALLIGFAALAAVAGLEIILGTFIAGVLLNLVNPVSMKQPNFRLKLEAIGYGFLVPVFFVSSGLRLDLHALTASPSALARVPLFLIALLVARGLPAFLYRSTLSWRDVVAAGFLQATSLTFIVAATSIGLAIGTIRPDTAAALVSAGVLSVVLFPLIALSLAVDSGR